MSSPNTIAKSLRLNKALLPVATSSPAPQSYQTSQQSLVMAKAAAAAVVMIVALAVAVASVSVLGVVSVVYPVAVTKAAAAIKPSHPGNT